MDAEKCKRKLLFIPYTFTNGGGAEKILQLLINSLPADGIDIDIQEIEQFDKFLELRKGVNLRFAFMNQSFPEKSFNELNYILLVYFPFILKNVFLLNKFDTIIAFNYQLPSFMLPSFSKEKTIAWFHGDLYDLNEKSKEWEKNKQAASWKNTNKIVTISKKSQQSLFDIFPEFADKSLIIHNGTDTKRILELCNEDCEIPFKNIPYICCVGRLDENKNFILAIRVIAELQKTGIDYGLVLVGDGNQKELLKKEAEELNISDKVFFAGFQTNPYKYIAKSKILCVTSFSEGWGLVITEAMTLGKPFVTTPVAGASEELSDGGRCGLVAGYKTEEYAKAVAKLITDDALYNQMSKNCIEHVKEYTAEKYAENFVNVLNEINKKPQEKIKSSNCFTILFSYILYFLFYIFSIGSFVFRIQIINKRLKEKKYIKVIKNLVLFFILIIVLPVFFIPKCLYFPFYIRKIIKKSGKKCR